MSSLMEVNVLGMKRWSMTDENTGEVREGVTVFIAQDTEDLSGKTLGLDVMKMSAPLSVFEKAKLEKFAFPAECRLRFSLKLAAGGKPAMQVLDVEQV